MAKTYINGELVSSSTNYAAAIEYTKKDGSKTTVQDGIDNLREDLNNLLPFKLGIDANGNYGYYKDGADTVTPFSQMAKGTSTYSGYSKATKVTLGWKPRAVMAYCVSGGGYVISWFYAEGLLNHNLRRSTSNYTGSDMISVDDTGFSWTSIDSTWGTQTITYIAIR